MSKYVICSTSGSYYMKGAWTETFVKDIKEATLFEDKDTAQDVLDNTVSDHIIPDTDTRQSLTVVPVKSGVKQESESREYKCTLCQTVFGYDGIPYECPSCGSNEVKNWRTTPDREQCVACQYDYAVSESECPRCGAKKGKIREAAGTGDAVRHAKENMKSVQIQIVTCSRQTEEAIKELESTDNTVLIGMLKTINANLTALFNDIDEFLI